LPSETEAIPSITPSEDSASQLFLIAIRSPKIALKLIREISIQAEKKKKRKTELAR